MSLTIQLTSSAERDLEAIADYTEAEWGRRQAFEYMDKLLQKIQSLAFAPGIGRARENLAAGVRSLPAGGHVIFYTADPSTLMVLRVCHAAMDIENISFEPLS